ncbi:hypothetical protein BDZ85DRAFT_135617 [Elsinoe ampelina]|uniref:BTB domain-containing protein n=1 Tax=Elsinoe ampelina TaxID=302913 RepID=A0A6A6G8U3_9PEZI|nr:hypothetical protein BDZ85DRAFT_135617 [Elsinoe ampelina]
MTPESSSRPAAFETSTFTFESANPVARFALNILHWNDPSGSSCVQRITSLRDVANHVSLLDSGAHSDCQIKAKSGRVFKLHLVIITRACPYFEKVSCGGFQEAEEKILDWSQHDELVIEATLKFIYGNDASNMFPHPEMADLGNHVRLYGFADSIQYIVLKQAVVKHLRRTSQTKMTAATLKSLLESVNQVDPHSQDLLDVATEWVETNLAVIKKLPEDEKSKYAQETPLLALLLLRAESGPISEEHLYTCQSDDCGKSFRIKDRDDVLYCPACGKGPSPIFSFAQTPEKRTIPSRQRATGST